MDRLDALIAEKKAQAQQASPPMDRLDRLIAEKKASQANPDGNVAPIPGGGGPAQPSAESAEPSLARRLTAMGARIALPVAGGIVGNLPGAAVGGALGEAAGEWIEGQPLSAARIALAAPLSAIPGIPVGPSVAPVARVGLRALEGAAQGAIATGATRYAETGELPSLPEVGAGALGGAALGAAGGGIETALLRRQGRRAVAEALDSFGADWAKRRAIAAPIPASTPTGGATAPVGGASPAAGALPSLPPGPGTPGVVPPVSQGSTVPVDVPPPPPEGTGSSFTTVPGLAGKLTEPPGPRTIPPATAGSPDRMEQLATTWVDRIVPWADDNAKDALRTLVRDNVDTLQAAKRGTQSWARSQMLGQELIPDLRQPLPTGTAPNAEQAVALGNAVGAGLDRIQRIKAELLAAPTPELQRDLGRQLEARTMEVVNAMVGASAGGSELGRGLNAQKIAAQKMGASYDGQLIIQARKQGVNATQIVDVLTRTPNDRVQQLRMLRDLARGPTTPREWFRWFYFNNILSGPRTHERNLLSNIISLATRPAATVAAAPVDAMRSRLTGAERQVYLGEAPLGMIQAAKAIPEAVQKFTFMMKNGFSLDDLSGLAHGQFELSATREVPGGMATNVISRSLAAADEFFRALGFNMELHAGAYQRARNAAARQGMAGPALRQATADGMARLLADPPTDLMAQAVRFSSRVTFQEESGPITRALLQVRNAVGLPGDFLMPFVRTPANLFRQGLEFSPAGFVMQGVKHEGRAGAQALGEAVLGSTLMIPVALLAVAGRLTGDAPQDLGERALWEAEGKTPYSIRAGNRWIPYMAMGPLFVPFAFVANAYQQFRRSKGVPSSAAIGALVAATGKSLFDQSFMSGLSQAMEALKDPDGWGPGVMRQYAQAMVPLSGAMRTAAQATDPYLRDPEGLREGVQSILPGASRALPPKLDLFGEPVRRPATGLAALDITGLATPTRPLDPVRTELQRLKLGARPAARRETVMIGNVEEPVTREEDFARRQVQGALLKRALTTVVGNPRYQALPADIRADTLQAVRQRMATTGTRLGRAAHVRGTDARTLLRERRPEVLP